MLAVLLQGDELLEGIDMLVVQSQGPRHRPHTVGEG